MKKLIRIPGLIGFFAFVSLIAIVLIVFLDTWIKLAATKGLEQATGAEVNIASVSHSFSPFGVSVNGLQLTDPKKPTHNQMQASQITAQISLMPLLMQKVIIDDLTVSGVQFSQPRESEGAVYIEVEDLEQSEGFADEIEIPSVDEILAKSPLKTTKAAEDVQAAYDKHNENLQAQYEALPSKEKLAEYQSRLKELKDVDYKDPVKLASAKKAFDEILDELKQDKKKLTDFKAAVQEAKGDLSPKLAALKAAPGQDYDQLQALIAGDSGAINDVTKLILGEKAAVWSDYLLSAYQVVGPMLVSSGEKKEQQKRADGKWIEFSDETPLPDLLIKKAVVSLIWQDEEISSDWKDITYQHDKIGRPTVFEINSTASKLWQSLVVKGDFRLIEQTMSAAQNWDLKGLKLSDLALLDEQKLATKIDSSLLSSKGSLSVKDNLISGGGKIDLYELAMTAKGSNQMTDLIANTLNGLDNLSINADLEGAYDDPDISFSSNLDKQLGKALLGNLSGEQKQKLADLKQKLTGQAAGPLGEKSDQLGEWQDWEKLADGDLSSVEDMMKSQFNDALDKQKDKLKDKLKSKLFG
jgi:uncharacterized protein (TIGR03545 family)